MKRAALTIVILLGMARMAEALSCSDPGLLYDYLFADNIFIGQIVEEGEMQERGQIISGGMRNVVVQVEKVFKGDMPDKINGLAAPYSRDDYTINKKYLVFAYKYEDKYYFGYCSGRTVLYENINDEVEKIEEMNNLMRAEIGASVVHKYEPRVKIANAPWRYVIYSVKKVSDKGYETRPQYVDEDGNHYLYGQDGSISLVGADKLVQEEAYDLMEIDGENFAITTFNGAKAIRKRECFEGHCESHRYVYDENDNYLGDLDHPEVDRIEILNAGTYKLSDEDKICDSFQCYATHPNLDPSQIHATETIEAELYTTFGVAYKVFGSPEKANVEITIKFIHPPITNSETGEVLTVEEFIDSSKINENDYAGWIFERAWEIVPGEWTIQLIHEDKVLAEQVFVVYDSVEK